MLGKEKSSLQSTICVTIEFLLIFGETNFMEVPKILKIRKFLALKKGTPWYCIFICMYVCTYTCTNVLYVHTVCIALETFTSRQIYVRENMYIACG